MISNMAAICGILAQEANPEQPGLMAYVILFGPLVLLMIVMQVLFGRNESKEKARKEALVSSLKKNDPVVTIGGILGTVVSVAEDKTTVTIRVDDNSRIKVQASAIREVLASQDGGDKA